MNVLIRYFCEPQYLFKVPRTVFRPQPHVDAAMTCFALRTPEERLLSEAQEQRFKKVVSGAFLAKRKRLTNSMQVWPLAYPHSLSKAGWKPLSRHSV